MGIKPVAGKSNQTNFYLRSLQSVANKIRLIIGIAVWIAVVFFVTQRFASYWGRSSDGVMQKLARFVSMPRRNFDLEFDQFRVIRIGDPIFHVDDQGRLIQIGSIRQVDTPESKEYLAVYTDWASAAMFSTAPSIRPGDYVTYHQTPESMDWVIRFMLPPEKRQEILALIATTFDENSAVILQELMPILQAAVGEASIIIREELVRAVGERRQQWQSIGRRFKSDIVDEEVIPLVNDEIWPIVQRQATPLMEQIGEQIWKRASIWRFGWRSLYDSLPLPEQNLTQQEFARFVEQEAIPVLQAHLPDFLEIQRRVLLEASNNEQVQEVFQSSLQEVVNDPELQLLVLDILREVFFENQRLRDTLLQIWQSPQTQRVLSLADERLEPAVLQIGESLFGSPTGGVTAEFARILRNKILKKDSRWLVLRHKDDPFESPPEKMPSEPGVLAVVGGQSAMENPFYKPARDR